jgi:hypothetical protein
MFFVLNVRITANVAPQKQENCLHKDLTPRGVTGILRVKIHRNQTFLSFALSLQMSATLSAPPGFSLKTQ